MRIFGTQKAKKRLGSHSANCIRLDDVAYNVIDPLFLVFLLGGNDPFEATKHKV